MAVEKQPHSPINKKSLRSKKADRRLHCPRSTLRRVETKSYSLNRRKAQEVQGRISHGLNGFNGWAITDCFMRPSVQSVAYARLKKLNTLRQRQRIGVVDRDGLA